MNTNPNTCKDTTQKTCDDANRDPLSNEPGAHPVGVGVGAAVGGAALGGAAVGAAALASAATGAAMGGTVGGPVGVVAGAVMGAVAGGLAGKSVAEKIDPTREDAYWKDNYSQRPYAERGTAYDTYRPAYQYGWEARGRYPDRQFDDVEADLERDWQKTQGKTSLPWTKAKPATRDAWDRIK